MRRISKTLLFVLTALFLGGAVLFAGPAPKEVQAASKKVKVVKKNIKEDGMKVGTRTYVYYYKNGVLDKESYLLKEKNEAGDYPVTKISCFQNGVQVKYAWKNLRDEDGKTYRFFFDKKGEAIHAYDFENIRMLRQVTISKVKGSRYAYAFDVDGHLVMNQIGVHVRVEMKPNEFSGIPQASVVKPVYLTRLGKVHPTKSKKIQKLVSNINAPYSVQKLLHRKDWGGAYNSYESEICKADPADPTGNTNYTGVVEVYKYFKMSYYKSTITGELDQVMAFLYLVEDDASHIP